MVTEQDATALLHQAMPLCATLGVRADKYAADEVALTLDWAPALCTTGGILHGGVIMALADSAGAATIESRTNFLGAVRAGGVVASATPLHTGGTTIVVETAVRDSSGRLVAKVTQTQMVLRPRG